MTVKRPYFLSLVITTLLASPAFAAVKVEPVPNAFEEKKPPINTDGPAVSEKDPVILTADRVEYDQMNDVAIATGHVEIIQNDTVVMADQVIYDRKRDQVHAQGNVSMLESTGNVYFADQLEFQNEMKTGVIHQFRARLSDDSLFVANGAWKVNETITKLAKAAYTPCDCDENGKPKTPTWSVKAKEVEIDQGEKIVRYEDATFNVGKVPVLYTPYFSHPTPDAGNQSGLLTPEIMSSRNLGTVYKQPLYYAMAPDKDITVTPMITSQQGLVGIGEYRQQFDAGPLRIEGSATKGEDFDVQGNREPGRTFRGHIDASGTFKYDADRNWGFDVRRASDETYLHRYNFSGETLLTSRVYGENFRYAGPRSYASAEALSFQGLTAQDDAKKVPVVLPLMNANWQSEPGWHDSRFALDGNIMALTRKDGNDTRRLSAIARWNLPYITEDGQVIELDTQLRSDVYQVQDVLLSNGREFSGTTGRTVPQVSLTWRYPFINQFENSSLLLEPVGNFTVSPGGGNPEKIPNEDSLLPDFTDANLFSPNRFAGLDRVENGARFSYGMRGQAQFQSDKFVDWLFGQQYRINDDPTFPIANDLTSRLSDYVGKVGITYSPISFAYRFRLDKNNMSPHRSEFDAGYNAYPLTLNASYLELRNDPVLADRKVVTGNGSLNLTSRWSVNAQGSRDLQRDEMVSIYTGLGYKNECVNVTTMVGKDYTSLIDIEPSLTFWLRVSLRNLD